MNLLKTRRKSACTLPLYLLQKWKKYAMKNVVLVFYFFSWMAPGKSNLGRLFSTRFQTMQNYHRHFIPVCYRIWILFLGSSFSYFPSYFWNIVVKRWNSFLHCIYSSISTTIYKSWCMIPLYWPTLDPKRNNLSTWISNLIFLLRTILVIFFMFCFLLQKVDNIPS